MTCEEFKSVINEFNELDETQTKAYELEELVNDSDLLDDISEEQHDFFDQLYQATKHKKSKLILDTKAFIEQERKKNDRR